MRYAIKTSPQLTTWKDLLEVWQTADQMDVFHSAWNFDQFSLDRIVNDHQFISDVGFELKLSLNTFYRIPMRAYFIMAFPLNDLSQTNMDRLEITDIDNYRIYFGLGF